MAGGGREGRRAFLRQSFLGMGVLASGRHLAACWSSTAAAPMASPVVPRAADAGSPELQDPVALLARLGELGAPDDNGVRLPAGFRSRVVARSGQRPVSSSDYIWHPAPDGGAVFATADGGWVYVSNSEVTEGGAGALRFDRTGEPVDAYSILQGTSWNCAGGPTPWQSWLSCEEVTDGKVWQCDPLGRDAAEVLPALGIFRHEAVAVDPRSGYLYLTEDQPDGRLYRYVPREFQAGRPNLHTGRLEVAQVVDTTRGSLQWHPLPDPGAVDTATRRQVPQSSSFNGGEGIWYHGAAIYFATKGDDRVWALQLDDQHLSVLYDATQAAQPVLHGVDNVTVSEGRDVLVAEDLDDMQIVAVAAGGLNRPLLQVVGQDSSEITGPALDPSGQRLYFSSQRGESGEHAGGITYEVTGPFTTADD